MERGSVQHGARLDEEMAEEVASLTHGAPLESRAREDLEAEPPAEGEPTPDALLTAGPADPGAGLSHDEVELRSEIARHLRPSAFPARRDDLLIVAEEERASDAILSLLASLPGDVEFHQVSEVWLALGGEVEHRDEGEAQAAQVEPDTAEITPEPATVVPEPVRAAEQEPVRAEPAQPSAPPERGGADAPGCNPVAILIEALRRVIRRAPPGD